ncbi:AraC family transcriptional regulator [Caballeronia sp. LZ035]|uniref:AraC family transcriptional regulator n=1 Tax=Caballeronia sp. LZ035 TaxID=3038568 RepID=UPI00285A874D|nr:AraC family transcriptional regulator [Caballeronia sp. LZ035]MDR5760860.1 AraC family transcriptional regulator [Caballeronia sp. LZ035]
MFESLESTPAPSWPAVPRRGVGETGEELLVAKVQAEPPEPSKGVEDDAAPNGFDVFRWTSDGARTWSAKVPADELLVALCLRQSLATLAANEMPFHDGVIDRGAMIVVPPGFDVRGTFHTATDFMHVHVPCATLTEWLDAGTVPDMAGIFGKAPLHVRDSVAIKLTGTLLRTVHGRASASSMYADGIVLSILARLLEIIAARAAVKPPRASSVSPLEAWRVKIAVDFIDQRIDQSLTLAELGASVGLSPMHFAARFRAATGTSPHTFILRRKIQHAQTLLATTRSTVADIAFSVGFRTQAHFTTVFRRHVDDTPYRWRAKHGALHAAMANGG